MYLWVEVSVVHLPHRQLPALATTIVQWVFDPTAQVRQLYCVADVASIICPDGHPAHRPSSAGAPFMVKYPAQGVVAFLAAVVSTGAEPAVGLGK